MTMAAAARAPFTGPGVWHGPELEADDGWIWRLDDGEIGEIEAALEGVRGRPWAALRRDDFPLPTLGHRLARAAEAIENGRGVVRLRGLPVGRFDEESLRTILWGLGTHLGTARYQNVGGELIGEVRDEVRAFGAVRLAVALGGDGALPLASRARARSNGPLRFHTDRCDAIALLCVRPARRGGVSRLASAMAVHNAMLARRPELCELLYHDYPRSRLGEEVGGEGRWYLLPVFAVHRGHFTTHYSRTFVEAAQCLPDCPRLSPAQDEALDLHAALCEELCAEVPFEPGDLQIINNHVVYHARTAFEDDPEGGCDRLLFRLWLAMPNSRPLPPGHEVLWGSIAPGALRGGVALAERAPDRAG